MECDEDGLKCSEPAAAGARGIKRQRGAGAARDVRLVFATAVPGAAAARSVQHAARAPRDHAATRPQPQDPPFMSNMDEISYWVYTKRAPCLFNYDNIVKQQVQQPQCSTTKPLSIHSKEEDPTPKKKKLKLLDEDSVSTEKQQNIYFKTPEIKKPTPDVRKSEGAGSDIEFIIETPSAQKKSKNLKLQKNCTPRVPKKNKLATSTPKVVNLRRSLRKTQQSCNNNSHLNDSFEIFDPSIINGKQEPVKEEANQPDEVATNNQDKSQSRSSSVSRYPRRNKNKIKTSEPNCSRNIINPRGNTTGRKYNMRKVTRNINRKENSEENIVSRTRSGKRRGSKLDVEESGCSVLQLNSSTEQSSLALNVAGPNTRSMTNNAYSRCLRSRTVRDKVGQLYKESSSEGSDKKLSDGMPCALEQSTPKCDKKVKKTSDRQRKSLCRDSLRNKSGFAACFSDSDSDSAPLNQRKFFC